MNMFAQKRFVMPVIDPPYDLDIKCISKYDAEVLGTILRAVGGPPRGLRGAAERLLEVLQKAGVNVHAHDDEVKGGIIFHDTPA